MKKTICFLVIVCMVSQFYLMSVCASSNISAKYDSSKTALALSGNFGDGSSDLLTTISVFKAGASLNDGTTPGIFETVFTDDEGKIDVSIKIPSSFESEKYTVRIANEKGSYDKDFLYAKSSDIYDVMLLMNDADTPSDAAGIITSNYTELALDSEVTAPYVTELSKAYIELCSDTDYTDETVFYFDFMQCLAAAEIKKGDDVQTVLNNYKIYIGSEVDQINTYPESVRSLIKQYVSDAKYSDGLLSEQLPLLRVLAFFKSSATWGAAKLNVLGIDAEGNEYIDNFDILSPDHTYYSKVTNINLVYEKLFEKKSSITTFDKLKEAFETAAQNVYDEQNKEDSYKGGSSTSSGSVPTASFVPGTQIQPEQSTSSLSDINGHWAQTQIELLATSGVISGYPDGTFGPARNVTRAEFAKMIIAFSGLSLEEGNDTFSDVDSTDWFLPYVLTAYNNGLVKGVSQTEFSPAGQITRQDVCVIICRYLDDRIPLSENLEFSDASQVAPYAEQAIAALSDAGIITGYADASFRPQNPITRAEVAVMLSRVTDYLK